MKPLSPFALLCAMALCMVGCASSDAHMAVETDPTLNPLGVVEVAPEDAKSLLPADVEAERAILPVDTNDDVIFQIPPSVDSFGTERMVFGINPYANTARGGMDVRQLSAFNESVAAELRTLTRFGIREVSTVKPAEGITHLLDWRAEIVRVGDTLKCDVTVDVADVAKKVTVAQDAFSLTADTPQKGETIVPQLRALGKQVGVMIVSKLYKRFPYQGAIASTDETDLFVLEGGAFQGVYEGMQFLIYAETQDGLQVPLAYADAMPGSTRTNLKPWAFNEADSLAKTILGILDDEPEAYKTYNLHAIAVGNPLSPLQRRRLAQ